MVCSIIPTVTLIINTQIMHIGEKKNGDGDSGPKCLLNQLPRLSGRWVPGIPLGFHCGQPAPRQNTVPMAGKSPQPSHRPPLYSRHRHMDKTVEERKIRNGRGGRH